MKRWLDCLADAKSTALAFALISACGPDDGSKSLNTQDSGAPSPLDCTQSDTTCSPAESAGTPDAQVGETPKSAECTQFDSTFAAIQKVIFEGHGCTASTCHGEAKSGDLDLRAGAAYRNLVEAKSKGSSLPRVLPGSTRESFLFLKLQAATEPGSVQVAGSPMPSGAAPLSADELSAVRAWIAGGAPEKGSIIDSTSGRTDVIAAKLNACLPKGAPIAIKPLEPPAPNEGIQFQMPSYVLKASTEREFCMAFYYDFTDKVPAEFKDETGEFFYVNGSRLRQDPNSHHFIYIDPGLGAESVTDPAFGKWTCYDGPRDGQECNPLDTTACGEGVCASKQVDGLACAGFGPKEIDLFTGKGTSVINAQAAQQYLPAVDGAFSKVRLKGLFYYNTHAFNLTDSDLRQHARLNFNFTKDRRFFFGGGSGRPIGGGGGPFNAPSTPPFQKETVCAKIVAQQNSRLVNLAGHTHKHGERFWVNDPSGKMFYENTSYSEPLYLYLDPPMLFDSADPAQRTLEFCATYNNGVKADGTPNVDLVTRFSKMIPGRTTCTPVACVKGKVGSACSTHQDCDSTPGAGDGSCDACPITGGETTENEMLILLPWFLTPVK